MSQIVLKINALQKYCRYLILTAYLHVWKKTLQMYCVFRKTGNNIKTVNTSAGLCYRYIAAEIGR